MGKSKLSGWILTLGWLTLHVLTTVSTLSSFITLCTLGFNVLMFLIFITSLISAIYVFNNRSILNTFLEKFYNIKII